MRQNTLPNIEMGLWFTKKNNDKKNYKMKQSNFTIKRSEWAWHYQMILIFLRRCCKILNYTPLYGILFN